MSSDCTQERLARLRPRVMTIYGTRPEAIKVAPVIRAVDSSSSVTSVTVVTGQHREMLDQVNQLFGIQPHFDLDVFSPGQSLNSLASQMLARLDPVLDQTAPNAVLVQGDTTTALAGALAAFYRGIRVVHLEAGLRTGTLTSPFPEEANRRLISHLSSLHLAPTAGARDNLLREGIDAGTVVVTGNTVIDALLHVVALDRRFGEEQLRRLEASGRPIVLVTVHRRESWGEPLENVGRAVRRIAREFSDHVVVLPLHLNPRVRSHVLPHVRHLANVVVTDPLDYADFSRLMRISHVILTDSGGIQEEAPSLGKPVLVLRDNTERPEAVAAGTVKLVGTDEERIVRETALLLTDPGHYSEMATAINPYGDGSASPRASAAISHLLGVGPRREDYAPPATREPDQAHRLDRSRPGD